MCTQLMSQMCAEAWQAKRALQIEVRTITSGSVFRGEPSPSEVGSAALGKIGSAIDYHSWSLTSNITSSSGALAQAGIDA